MALVGEAHIIVRAITSGVERDIRNGFQNIEGTGTEAGQRLGRSYGTGFLAGYRNSKGNTVFSRLGDAFRAVEGQAEAARVKLSRMVELGYVLGPAIYAVVGGVSALVVGLGTLVASAAGAAASLAAVGASLLSLKIGFSVANFALKGVSQAVNQASAAGGGYTKTIKEMREELQQLRFDAEEAGISEKEAALNVEKARQNLLRMQDLPPNSIARREAEIEYERAEFAYRKAKDRREDLAEEAEKGLDGIKEQNKAAASGVDPYANLTPSQKKFAQYLVSIKDEFKELREVAASGFLPKLQEAIESLMEKAFPNLKTGVGQISSAMGDAAKGFAAVFTTDANQEQFALAMENVAKNIKPLGTVFGNFAAGFTRFFNLSQPLTDRFNTWIDGVAKGFDQWTIDEADGIQDFLKRAGDAAAILGDILSNVFGGLGGIINEALNPDGGGIGLLEWLRDATAGFKNIGNDPALSGFLSQAGETAQHVFGIIGKILSAFLKLAGDPNVTEFFRKINEEFPTESVEKAISALSEALPVLADVFNNIVEILADIASSPATKFFFDTLKVLTDILKPAAKLVGILLVFAGPLFAIFKGVARVASIMKFLGLAALGAFNFIKRFFTFFKRGADTAKRSTDTLKKGIDRTKADISNMTRATQLAERAFKNLNTALQKLNTTMKVFADRVKAAATSMTRVKESATKAHSPIKNLKDESGKAAEKFKRVKTEGDKAKTALDKIKTSAQKAREELRKLGSTKTAPSIGGGGMGGGMSGGMGGGGGGGSTFIGNPKGMLSKIGDFAKSPLGKAGIFGAIAVAVPMATQAASDIADAARKSTFSLETLARANGGFGDSSKVVADRLVGVADNMGAATGQNFENIKSVQNLLLRYPDLAEEADIVGGKFDRMTGLAVDMAGVMGVDAPSAAYTMAESLRDPTTAVDNLAAAGIRLTDEEKKKYDAFLETNDVAGAQEFLLDTLTTKYGGYASQNATANDKIAARWDTINRKLSAAIQPINDWISGGLLWLVESLFGGPKSASTAAMDSAISRTGTALNNNRNIGYRPGGSFAEGGVIFPQPGGHIVQVAEAGKPERIEPLDANGLSERDKALISFMGGGNSNSGVQITVNAGPGMNENEIAEIVSRKLAFQVRKGMF